MMHLGTSLSSKAEPPLDQCSHAHADRGACIWATQPSLAHHDGSGGKSSTPAALPSGTGGGGVSAAGGDADHPCLLAMTNHRKRQVSCRSAVPACSVRWAGNVLLQWVGL
eukprot:scaffold169410_cov18-Tisochrysis_lutea.AAC.2